MEQLATEVHIQIIHYVNPQGTDLDDLFTFCNLISLCLTNRYFYKITYPHLAEALSKFVSGSLSHPPWIKYPCTNHDINNGSKPPQKPSAISIVSSLNRYQCELERDVPKRFRPWILRQMAPKQSYPIPRQLYLSDYGNMSSRQMTSKLGLGYLEASRAGGRDRIRRMLQQEVLNSCGQAYFTFPACSELKAICKDITLRYDEATDAFLVSTKQVDEALSKEKQLTDENEKEERTVVRDS